ncbi:hypothetical protein EVAR_49335_1 [Eumeta japonica]|uniref:Sodium/hydrogen exchanger 8 n=1 Tax=Eumeta variegata TaxID=151549 RepID=A0A4C1XU77_EUMVA|nr:hypothetical protein EVAR_49335_1 [Eumeta japonica]
MSRAVGTRMCRPAALAKTDEQHATENLILEEEDRNTEDWPIRHDMKQQLMEKMGSEMTKEQLELEKEVEAKQLETIFKLLQEQKDKLQVSNKGANEENGSVKLDYFEDDDFTPQMQLNMLDDVSLKSGKFSRSKRSDHDILNSSEASILSDSSSNIPVSLRSSNGNSNVYESSSTLSSVQLNVSSTVASNISIVGPSDAAPLPEKSSAEDEHNSSMSIFFVLCVLALGILLIHLMLQTGFSYLPESVVIVFLGALIGMIINLMSIKNIANWRKEEAFSPTAFFLVLLPPIIFESGYNLHKGNFFQNIGSILLFAIVGTAISAFVIGAGIYLLGLAQVVYRLNFVESFAFGSLISAVDPVATVAIFHALDVDPVLNMLVFGESILNDAIAIVLTTAVLDSNDPNMSTGEAVLSAINRFWLMFFASAGIGVLFALVSALLLKHVDLRKNPSLEFGIMAILFCGIVMSHYTHFNLSTVTQVTMQQTMRTLAFIAETCVFAYLGLALFSFKHRVEPALVVWSIIMCLLGRAVNIFPLAMLCNKFREHKITKKMMFIMWFSGLRGAISYALSLHLDFSKETRHVIITTTLIIVLFTTLFFGGSTMPLLKFLRANKKSKKLRSLRKQKEVSLSKTKEWGQTIDSEHLSEITEEELEELKDCKSQMTDLTNQWYQAIRISNDRETDEEESLAQSSLSNSRSSLQRGV